MELLLQVGKRDLALVILLQIGHDAQHQRVGDFFLAEGRQGGPAADSLRLILPLLEILAVPREADGLFQRSAHLVHVEGLEHIVRHTVPDGLLGILELRVARQDDSDVLVLLPGVGDHLKAALHRHGDVGDDDVGPQLCDLFFAHCPVLGLRHDAAPIFLPRHRIADALADDLFVFYQQNAIHGLPPSPPELELHREALALGAVNGQAAVAAVAQPDAAVDVLQAVVFNVHFL